MTDQTESLFPKQLNMIPDEWHSIARGINMPNLKIPIIFNVFKDRMIFEERTSSDWEKEWEHYIISSRI